MANGTVNVERLTIGFNVVLGFLNAIFFWILTTNREEHRVFSHELAAIHSQLATLVGDNKTQDSLLDAIVETQKNGLLRAKDLETDYAALQQRISPEWTYDVEQRLRVLEQQRGNR